MPFCSRENQAYFVDIIHFKKYVMSWQNIQWHMLWMPDACSKANQISELYAAVWLCCQLETGGISQVLEPCEYSRLGQMQRKIPKQINVETASTGHPPVSYRLEGLFWSVDKSGFVSINSHKI